MFKNGTIKKGKEKNCMRAIVNNEYTVYTKTCRHFFLHYVRKQLHCTFYSNRIDLECCTKRNDRQIMVYYVRGFHCSLISLVVFFSFHLILLWFLYFIAFDMISLSNHNVIKDVGSMYASLKLTPYPSMIKGHCYGIWIVYRLKTFRFLESRIVLHGMDKVSWLMTSRRWNIHLNSNLKSI